MKKSELDMFEEFLENEQSTSPPQLFINQYYFIPKLKTNIEGNQCQIQIKEYFVKGMQSLEITNQPEEGLEFGMNMKMMKSSLKTKHTSSKYTNWTTKFSENEEQSNTVKRVTFNVPIPEEEESKSFVVIRRRLRRR